MAKEKFGEYTIEKLREGLYAVEDENESSFYVIEGEKMAAVIDTGMGKEPVLPLIRHITALPCVLLLTHAHGDHMKYAGSFEKRYICSKDIPIVALSAERMGMDKSLGELDYTPFDPGSMLELGGGTTLESVAMYGHTPGSLGFYCEKYNVLFSGDAVGSGMGVWMQVPGALTVEQYGQNLKKFMDWAESKPADMEFLTGHRPQRYGFPGMERDNPVSMALVEDMIRLCEMLQKGEISGENHPFAVSFGSEGAKLASFGRAGIVYLDSRIM